MDGGERVFFFKRNGREVRGFFFYEEGGGRPKTKRAEKNLKIGASSPSLLSPRSRAQALPLCRPSIDLYLVLCVIEGSSSGPQSAAKEEDAHESASTPRKEEALRGYRFSFARRTCERDARLQFSPLSSLPSFFFYSPVLGLLDQCAGEGARMRACRPGQDTRRGGVLRRARRDARKVPRGRRRDHRGTGGAGLAPRGLLRGVPGLGREAREHDGFVSRERYWWLKQEGERGGRGEG